MKEAQVVIQAGNSVIMQYNFKSVPGNEVLCCVASNIHIEMVDNLEEKKKNDGERK